MLTTHLRAAGRHFRHEKGFTAINIFGLALGLAACIFITLYVVDEGSYDRYNVKADRIFRLASDLHINGGTINEIHTPPSRIRKAVRLLTEPPTFLFPVAVYTRRIEPESKAF